MREFEIILVQTQRLLIKGSYSLILLLKEHFKTFCEAFVVELKLTMRIIKYL